jgi:proline dehydrogenase
VSAFIPVLRGALLSLSQQPQLRRWLETSPAARRFTSRFIAGLTLEDAIRVTKQLRGVRAYASLDYLGENVRTLGEANASRDAYLQALARIAAEDLAATISMKVTSVGLDISEQACWDNTRTIAEKALATGSRVEMDMEDSSYTDRNLKLVHALHEQYGSVRAVIQAYLYRSESDINALCDRDVPVRLCKGAYREPPELAWPDKADVDRNFIKLMRILFDRGTHPAIATHDEKMIAETIAYTNERGVLPEQFEFEMLYGVGRTLQRRVIEQGYRLRVYVPYGAAWYPYFMRRLAERPANVWFLARNILQG